MAFLSERTLTSSRPCPALGVHKVGKLGKLGSRWQARHDFSASPIDFTARPVSLKPPQKTRWTPRAQVHTCSPKQSATLLDTPVQHPCGTLLSDTPVGHPTPPPDHPANANPTVTAKATEDLTKRCACTAKIVLYTSTCYVSMLHTSHESDTSGFHPKSPPKSFPQPQGLLVLS